MSQKAPEIYSKKKSAQESWSLSRILELEIQLFRDQKVDDEALVQRDQSIGREISQNNSGPTSAHEYILGWLEKLRQGKHATEIDALAREAPRRSNQALLLIYFFIGLSFSWSLIRYDGEQAVNVSAFLGIIILVQALAAILSLVLVFAGTLKPKLAEFSIGAGIARFFYIGLTSLFARIGTFSISSEQREDILAMIGRFRARIWIYQPSLRWTFFRIAQSLGVTFNLGVIVALLAAVTFSDRAFGWQTSLDVPIDSIHAFIKTLATPWSWYFPEGKGYPSLEQIHGSQIVLKEGIRSLQTTNLTSWWPFLLLATIVYGLLPRILLKLLATVRLNRSLKDTDLSNAETQRLLRRLKTHAPTFTNESTTSSSSANSLDDKKTNTPDFSDSEKYKVWVAPTLQSQFGGEELRNILDREVDMTEMAQLDESLINSPEKLEDALSNQANENICYALEAWLPPLEETKQLIRNTRASTDPKRNIHILLIGRTHPSLLPNFEQWKRTIQKMSDLYLTVSLHEV